MGVFLGRLYCNGRMRWWDAGRCVAIGRHQDQLRDRPDAGADFRVQVEDLRVQLGHGLLAGDSVEEAAPAGRVEHGAEGRAGAGVPRLGEAAAGQRRLRRGPALRVAVEQLLHPSCGCIGDLRARAPVPRAMQSFGDRLPDRIGRQSRGLVWPLAEEQDICGGTHGPHVDLCAVRLALQHLGCHVGCCAANTPELASAGAAHHRGESEVAELDAEDRPRPRVG
mmetsp:Transcript_97987/g.272651  ORF Transcript_97987/g.272651 Transcript_97987/m.272651 type:complete len:223 (+) Transcript_97987:592-1260(+)